MGSGAMRPPIMAAHHLPAGSLEEVPSPRRSSFVLQNVKTITCFHVSVYVCAFVYACLHECVHMCVYMCIWLPEANIGSLPNLVCWLALGIFCLLFRVLELWKGYNTYPTFKQVPGIRPLVLTNATWVARALTTEPSPQTITMNDNYSAGFVN